MEASKTSSETLEHAMPYGPCEMVEPENGEQASSHCRSSLHGFFGGHATWKEALPVAFCPSLSPWSVDLRAALDQVQNYLFIKGQRFQINEGKKDCFFNTPKKYDN